MTPNVTPGTVLPVSFFEDIGLHEKADRENRPRCHISFSLIDLLVQPVHVDFTALDHRQHDVIDLRIKLRTAAAFKLCDDLVLIKVITVDTVRRHRIKRIRNTDDSAVQWNLLTLQAMYIALSIPSLVMIQCTVNHMINERDILENLGALRNMRLHRRVFFIGQLSRLV